MNRFARMFQTSIGCKQVMAITAVILVLFVIGHLAGNLLVFQGPEAMNTYAATLKGLGPGLWIARAVLLAVFVLHIYAGLKLSLANGAARDVRYHYDRIEQASPLQQARVRAAMYMLQTGMVILAFVVFHLAHFTLGYIEPEAFSQMEVLPDGTERHDVHAMVIAGFSNPLIALSYVVAMLFLGAHLAHGVGSIFQTMGAHNPVVVNMVRVGAPLLVALIVIGNSFIPLSILFGLYPGSGS
jgi:succinate dehydrogenase / fumarate reductase, cytochrome b subunit